MNFIEKLSKAVSDNKSLLCVGLDPEPASMPPGIGIFEFNKAIIDATADLVAAYKPNIAFYEALGLEGMEALKRTREYIPERIPVIVDAKRGDIGNTARAYARALFDYFNFDATTASPYLGLDSLQPLIDYKDRGVFVLCRTSNAGAIDFQSLTCETDGDRRMLFEIVAGKVNSWNRYDNLGLVVGATYPEELKLIRERYPRIPMLIPGIGAQGGEISSAVRFGVDVDRNRTVINSSRQVLYASKGKDFAEKAREVSKKLRDIINNNKFGRINSYPLMTLKEVAELLHVHVNTVRRWSDLNIIKNYGITARGDRRFVKEDITQYLNELRNNEKELTPLITAKDVARLFNVKINTVTRWSESNIIKPYRKLDNNEEEYLLSDVISYLKEIERKIDTIDIAEK